MKVIRYIAVLCLCVLNYSCEDYLNRLPLDSPLGENFFNNETELEMAVTGVYNTLWFNPPGVGHPYVLTLEFASDNGWDRNGSGLQALGRGDANADNDFTGSFWSTFYRGIGRCNYIISESTHLADEMDPEEYNRLLAEVRFLRVYFYSYLSELFGDVPLLIEATSLEEAQMPRTPKAEVVDFMLSELDEVAELLPSEPENKARATKGAALALKSRIALYNERWEEAAQAAADLMAQGSYQLHDDYAELFKYAGENSPEIIMSVQYLRGVQTHNMPRNFFSRMALGHSNKKPPQDMVDTYESIDGLPIDESPLYDPQNPFENRDPRLHYTLVVPNSLYVRYIFNTNPDSTLTWDYGVDPPVRVENIEATHPYASFTGYLYRKHVDPADYPTDVGNSEQDMILFRYAEVLLNYAEAKIELNELDESVYNAINAIRTRPTVEMPAITGGKSQEELRNIIRKERRHELGMEGLRYFDIRRWRIAHEVIPGPLRGRIETGYLSEAPKIDEIGTPSYDNVDNADQMSIIEIRKFDPARDYLWPIPRIELETNPQLEQNPGY